jgi:two-component system, NarL family, sensor histidine kinase UhpB
MVGPLAPLKASALHNVTLTDIQSVCEFYPDAVVLVSHQGNIVGANALAQSLFGFPAQELIGCTIECLIPQRYAAAHTSHRAAFALAPQTRPMGIGKELVAQRKDGTELPVEISLSPMTTSDGPLVMAVVHDISDRKRAEQAMIESREQLRRLSAYLQQAREEERTVIAREVHDELGQSLTALKMDLANMEELLQQNTQGDVLPRLSERIRSMSDLISATVLTVRKISTQLRPVLLDSLGLVPAIEWQIEEFQNRTGIHCTSRVFPEEFDVERERSTAVFRILQEAMTNVARHAQATEMHISLELDHDRLILGVNDNGRGISDHELNQTKSFGLLGMRERALMFGGDLSISGEPGKGTTITLSIPVDPGIHERGEL